MNTKQIAELYGWITPFGESRYSDPGGRSSLIIEAGVEDVVAYKKMSAAYWSRWPWHNKEPGPLPLTEGDWEGNGLWFKARVEFDGETVGEESVGMVSPGDVEKELGDILDELMDVVEETLASRDNGDVPQLDNWERRMGVGKNN